MLGPLDVWRDGARVPLTAPRQRALLALLLLRANEPAAQDELIEALWDGAAPRTARAAFQNQIHALRRLLGAEAVERMPAGYVLHVAPDALDAERFWRLASDAPYLEARERAARLRDALALWRGTPFSELPGDSAAQAAAARLEEQRLGAVEERIDADLELGEHAALVPELQELVARHPLRERFWAQLMLALYRAGRQADALGSYRRAHDAFIGTLGIEPGGVLRELERGILVQDPALDDPKRILGSTLERAAALLPRDARGRAESLYEYGTALIRAEEFRQATSTFEAAARLADSAGDPGLVERVHLQRSYLAVFADGASMLDELQVAERAARGFAELRDESALALALSWQAHLLRDTGRAGDALRLASRAADLAARTGDREGETACLRMAVTCAALGPTPVPEAIALCETAAGSRDEADRVYFADALVWMLGEAGRIAEARELYDLELEELRRRGLVLLLIVTMKGAALAERAAGDLGRAAAHLRIVEALVRADRVRGDLAAAAGELACVLARQGEDAEAKRLAFDARAAVVPGDVLGEMSWRRALAVVAAQEGSHEAARRLSDEALTYAERTDWLTFRGETLTEAAHVRRLAGDAAGARDALAAALAAHEQKGNVAGAGRVREMLAGADPWGTGDG